MADGPPVDFSEISQRFSKLWQLLVKHGDLPRPPDERQMLIDQVRDALDRGEDHLLGKPRAILANTFTLEDRIYHGTETQVYRARHRDLGTFHAVKTLRDDHAGDTVASRRLLREAAIGLTLRHAAIVATQTLLRLDDGRPALISEWSGRRLADHLSEATLQFDDIVMIIETVLSALDVIHQAGFVHCDVSPFNLLIPAGKPMAPRLTDFNIAIPIGARHVDFDLALAGQPDFAAPEQVSGLALDSRCDLHAVGRLLLFLLDSGEAGSTGRTAPLRALARTLSAADPDARPSDARAALALLGNCVS